MKTTIRVTENKTRVDIETANGADFEEPIVPIEWFHDLMCNAGGCIMDYLDKGWSPEIKEPLNNLFVAIQWANTYRHEATTHEATTHEGLVSVGMNEEAVEVLMSSLGAMRVVGRVR